MIIRSLTSPVRTSFRCFSHYHNDFYGESLASDARQHLHLSSRPNQGEMTAILNRLKQLEARSIFCPKNSLVTQKGELMGWLAVLKKRTFTIATETNFLNVEKTPVENAAREICFVNRFSYIRFSIPAAAKEPVQ